VKTTAIIYIMAVTAVATVGGLKHWTTPKLAALAFITACFLAAEAVIDRWGTRRCKGCVASNAAALAGEDCDPNTFEHDAWCPYSDESDEYGDGDDHY
jgi:uncharacterized protein YqgC (DUF456 family)